MPSDQKTPKEADLGKLSTVAETVLVAFFDELAKTDDLTEVAASLRALVLDDKVFAEPAVQAALFPDAT